MAKKRPSIRTVEGSKPIGTWARVDTVDGWQLCTRLITDDDADEDAECGLAVHCEVRMEGGAVAMKFGGFPSDEAARDAFEGVKAEEMIAHLRKTGRSMGVTGLRS